MSNKRFILKLIVFVMTMVYIVSAQVSENVFAITTIAGDVDENGKIDLKDATQILRKAVGISDKWVLNTSTHKIHYLNCSDVKRIKPDNYSTSNSSVDELLAEGYTKCGHCFK